MTELETKLFNMLRASEEESKQRESRLLERIDSLQQQVTDSAQEMQKLAKSQKELIARYNKVAELLREELER